VKFPRLVEGETGSERRAKLLFFLSGTGVRTQGLIGRCTASSATLPALLFRFRFFIACDIVPSPWKSV
jgi:hypothetical protein